MKQLRTYFSTLVFTLFLVSVVAEDLSAQEARREATMAYNNARELVSDNQFNEGIELYREALSVSQSPACEDCGDITELVRGQLPRVYFARASNAFQQFRNQQSTSAADRAIEYFNEASEVGSEFGDDQVAQRSRAVIPQIYYNKSLLQYRQEDFSGALQSLERAVELNSNYTLAYYQKGIVLVNSDASLDETIAAFDQAIEVGQRVGDQENVNRARNRAGAELLYRAVEHIEGNRMGQALQMLNRAQNYTPNSANMHYRFAEVHNNRGDYNRAIEHANRALEYETGGVTDRAKIYFELGMAYKALDQVSNACGAFEDAAYGDFRGPAMHELEHELECEGYASRN